MWIIPSPISPYVQDTEELISDLDELSEVCGQSLMWRSKPSQSSTWRKRLKRDGWIQHLSGRILRHSSSASFTEKWTSSLEASLANPSVKQEKEEEQTTNDTYGPTSSRAFEIWGDLPLFSSRTLKESSQQRSEIKVFSTMSSSDWSNWVTTRRQEYSARVKSVEAISGSECLLWVCSTESKCPVLAKDVYWPIPQEEGSNSTSGNHRGKLNPRWVELLMGVPIGWTSPSCTHLVTIEWMKSECSETESFQIRAPEPLKSSSKTWPTVRAVETEGSIEAWQKTRKKKKMCGPSLSVAVKMWSTPLMSDHKRRGPNSKQQGLPNEV